MKRTLYLGIICAAFLSGTAGAPWAHGQEKAKTKVKAAAKPESSLAFFANLEAKRNEALVKADMATLDELTPEDYTFIDRKGHFLDKKQALGRVNSGQAKMYSMTLSGLKLRVYGDTAILTGRSVIKATINGQDSSGPILFTRVYVKRSGHWQSVAYQQTPAAQP